MPHLVRHITPFRTALEQQRREGVSALVQVPVLHAGALEEQRPMVVRKGRRIVRV